MATLFEFLLVGDDEEHLTAVGEAALDEVTRIEQLLSIHDPSSELSRINREASRNRVKLSEDLRDILSDCSQFHEKTNGMFDPCWGCPRQFADSVDMNTGWIRFLNEGTRIDLGGFAKGWALDKAFWLIHPFNIDGYFLHGGTSSAIAQGTQRDGSPWPVDLRSPDTSRMAPVGVMHLSNAALSCSADDRCGTVVVARSAAVAEAWSTAVLTAGVERANEFRYSNVTAVGWIEGTTLTWIHGSPT
jgi:thiamine biosynthesis lipoprotein